MEAMIAGVTAGAAGSSSADRPHPNSEENSPYDSRKPPPLDAKHSDASSTGVPEIREPNVAHTPPPGAFRATDPPTSQKNRFPPPQKSMYPTIRQASSFSFPSPGSPLHPQLNFSVSSPSLPYFPDSPVESTAKYRPRTRSPSDGADVRWYFCKTPLGPNGTVPHNPPIHSLSVLLWTGNGITAVLLSLVYAHALHLSIGCCCCIYFHVTEI